MRASPKQERSRETEAKLITAAVRLLRRSGLDGFTVPALAAEAGLAVGTLYRRFEDKASLLQHVFEAMTADGAACEEPEASPAAPCSLQDFVEAMVSQLMASYRTDAQILMALQQFARTHSDPHFRARILNAAQAGRQRLASALAKLPELQAREDGGEMASFAVFSCAAILQAAIVVESDKNSPSAAIDDLRLERQIKDMLVAYLA